MRQKDEIELSGFWDGKPAFVERAVFLEGGGFVPADVNVNYNYICVFKARGRWYLHEQGMWQCGSGYNGGSRTDLLAQVTDGNVAEYAKDYFARHPDAIRPQNPGK